MPKNITFLLAMCRSKTFYAEKIKYHKTKISITTNRCQKKAHRIAKVFTFDRLPWQRRDENRPGPLLSSFGCYVTGVWSVDALRSCCDACVVPRGRVRLSHGFKHGCLLNFSNWCFIFRAIVENLFGCPFHICVRFLMAFERCAVSFL